MSTVADRTVLHPPLPHTTVVRAPGAAFPEAPLPSSLQKQMESGSEQTAQAASEPGCWTSVVIIKIKLSPVIKVCQAYV